MGHFSMSVLVIVPTYNERDNIRQITAGVRQHGYDVLIVDDNSPDGTGAIADERIDVFALHEVQRLVVAEEVTGTADSVLDDLCREGVGGDVDAAHGAVDRTEHVVVDHEGFE